MSRTGRVARLEALGAERPAEAVDWEALGTLGVLTRECIELFLAREDPLDAHGHQLMMVGALTLDCLRGRTVSVASIEAVRQLMTNEEYRAHGWSEEKHPDALALFTLLQSQQFLALC